MTLTPTCWEEIEPPFIRGMIRGWFVTSCAVLFFGLTGALATLVFGGSWRVPLYLMTTGAVYIALILRLGRTAVQSERRFKELRSADD